MPEPLLTRGVPDTNTIRAEAGKRLAARSLQVQPDLQGLSRAAPRPVIGRYWPGGAPRNPAPTSSPGSPEPTSSNFRAAFARRSGFPFRAHFEDIK